MSSSRPPFSNLLPLFALMLWAGGLSALATASYLHLRGLPLTNGIALIREGEDTYGIPPQHFLRYSCLDAANRATRPIQAFNFPGMVGEAAMSGVMRTWPDSWRPSTFGDLPDDLLAAFPAAWIRNRRTRNRKRIRRIVDTPESPIHD